MGCCISGTKSGYEDHPAQVRKLKSEGIAPGFETQQTEITKV